jgi:hypothetical protein
MTPIERARQDREKLRAKLNNRDADRPMIRDAQALIEAYSALNRAEQRKFDARYRDLLKFRRDIEEIAELLDACGDTAPARPSTGPRGEVKSADTSR